MRKRCAEKERIRNRTMKSEQGGKGEDPDQGNIKQEEMVAKSFPDWASPQGASGSWETFSRLRSGGEISNVFIIRGKAFSSVCHGAFGRLASHLRLHADKRAGIADLYKGMYIAYSV